MIKIKTQKIMTNGEPHRRIVGIEALESDKLPCEYLETPDWGRSPYVYKSFTGGLYFCASGTFFEGNDNNMLFTDTINKEDLIPEQKFQEYVVICQVAGERLSDIKARNKERNPEHVQGIYENIMI